MLDVPMMRSLRFGLGGFFLMSTRSDYRTLFENLGPICTNSRRRSMSSRTIILRGDLYASSKILAIACTLAKSVKPTNCSGDIILTKGNPLSIAIFAAKAVLPDPLSP